MKLSMIDSKSSAFEIALLVTALIGAGAACGNAGDSMVGVDVASSSDDGYAAGAAHVSAGVAPGIDEEVLHEVTALGQKIEFVNVTPRDGDDDRLLAISARPRGTVDVVGALFEEYGPLTMLELFRAVAPAGTVPDQRLVASHVSEAAVLGRADSAVREANLQALTEESSDGVVLKATLREGAEQDCRTALFTPDANNVWTRVSILPHTSAAGQNAGFVCTGGDTGAFTDATANICTQSFQRPLKVGACAFSEDSPAGTIQVGLSLAPGNPIAFRNPDSLSPNEVFSFVSSGGVNQARMVIVIFPPEGVSSVYLMASGVSEPP